MGLCHGLRWGLLLAAIQTTHAYAQGVTTAVIPRGPAGPQVNMDAAGRAHVTPTQAQNGVSYNGFNQFDVGRPGLSFENQAVNARTIVAEVFSSAPSRIQGDMDVVGPRANLILANQNGISVNGANFSNFGSIALTTGAVSLRDQQQSQGHLQRYVDVATSRGTIEVGDQGMAGNLIRLEMIAKNIELNGPVTNSYSSSSAYVRMVAGDSNASFDTAASPVDNLTPWTYYQPGNAARNDVAIKVGAGSKVTAGRIEILVTDKGAGVRNDGEMVASAGNFSLSATGDLLQVGGQISAQGSVKVEAAGIDLQASAERQSLVSAGLQVHMQAQNAIRNVGGEIAGGQRVSDDSPYAVYLKAGDQIENRSLVGAEKTTVIFGKADSVKLEAGAGGIHSTNARIVSNLNLDLLSTGAIRNESTHIAGTDSDDWKSSSFLSRKNGYRVDMGSLADENNLGYWVAQGDMSINGASLSNAGGFIYANAGSIGIKTADGVTNTAHSVGQYEYRKRCFTFICKTKASSTEKLVGGQIMAANDFNLESGGTVLNDGGSMFAGQHMGLKAPRIIAQAKPVHTVILRDKGLKALFGDTWAQVYATDQGGSFTAQSGRMLLQGAAQQNGGSYVAAEGVEGEIEIIRTPQRDPVRLENHLGIFWW